MIIPMAVMRFITSNKSIRKNRKSNNTYRLGISLIGLVSLFFTLLEIVAIACHELSIVWFRYSIIIGAIIVTKIAVIIVAIIFVIHWIRSIILNRKSKERKIAKQKDA
jgi:O-antigen/teichoic acid export membrane protein